MNTTKLVVSSDLLFVIHLENEHIIISTLCDDSFNSFKIPEIVQLCIWTYYLDAINMIFNLFFLYSINKINKHSQKNHLK